MNSRAGQTSYRHRAQEFVKAVENCKKSFSSTLNVPSSSTAPNLEEPKSAASRSSAGGLRKLDLVSIRLHRNLLSLRNEETKWGPIICSTIDSTEAATNGCSAGQLHELSNMFTQLATLVSQQGELAIRIDENMDDTFANVEGAQGQWLSTSTAYPLIGS